MILLGLRSRPCDDGNGQRLSPQPSVRRDRQIDGVIGISAFSAVLPSSRPPFLPSFYLAAPSIRASVSSDVWQVGSVNGPSSFMAGEESSKTCCQQSMQGIASEITGCWEGGEQPLALVSFAIRDIEMGFCYTLARGNQPFISCPEEHFPCRTSTPSS